MSNACHYPAVSFRWRQSGRPHSGAPAFHVAVRLAATGNVTTFVSWRYRQVKTALGTTVSSLPLAGDGGTRENSLAIRAQESTMSFRTDRGMHGAPIKFDPVA